MNSNTVLEADVIDLKSFRAIQRWNISMINTGV